MSCEKCRLIESGVDPEQPHVLRKCPSCGADHRALDRPANGIGIDVKKGDQFIMPASFIKIAANPLKGSGQMSRAGIMWFAELVFNLELMKVERTPQALADAMEKLAAENNQFFRKSSILADIDQDTPEGAEEAVKRIAATPNSLEWYGLYAAILADHCKDSIAAGNAAEAAWAAACAERFRALAIFKRDFEEVAYMGNSAYRIVHLLRTWDGNQQNDNEAFWQATLTESSYAFSQMYSVPMTFIQGNAYVGGMKIDRSDARYLDFLFAGGAGRQALLIEIKTPATSLMKARKHRSGTYMASTELSGAVAQIQTYSDSLAREANNLFPAGTANVNPFSARRMVLVGNYEKEFAGDIEKASAFDRHRHGLANLEIVTFDEFFRKLEHLAHIFGLSRTVTLPEKRHSPRRKCLRLLQKNKGCNRSTIQSIPT